MLNQQVEDHVLQMFGCQILPLTHPIGSNRDQSKGLKLTIGPRGLKC